MTRFDTILPADSLEFCPHLLASTLFVCGTYKLEDQSSDDFEKSSSPDSKPSDEPTPLGQKRRGQCILFDVHDDGHAL